MFNNKITYKIIKISFFLNLLEKKIYYGDSDGIRTRVASAEAFETPSFDHSGTQPFQFLN